VPEQLGVYVIVKTTVALLAKGALLGLMDLEKQVRSSAVTLYVPGTEVYDPVTPHPALGVKPFTAQQVDWLEFTVTVPGGITVKINVAVTFLACDITTLQVPVPEHPSPLQPEKEEPTLAE